MCSQVSSEEWPSTKITPVNRPKGGMRSIAAAMLPASLRAGITTLPLGSSWSRAGGLATIQLVTPSCSSRGSWLSQRLGLALTEAFGRLEQRFQQPIMEREHQAGADMAEGLQPLQQPLNVDQGVEGVREQDHIEGFAVPQ
jgi:hypothetical protein